MFRNPDNQKDSKLNEIPMLKNLIFLWSAEFGQFARKNARPHIYIYILGLGLGLG